MKQSPARVALVLLFVFIGCFGTAYAAAGMLTALPAPAVGGTCGPSTGSETALEALVQPGSIGAGPEPPVSNATAHHQWQTFIQQCQSLADRRGLASLAVFVISVAVAATGLIWVLRRPRAERDADDSVDGSSDWPGEPGPGDPAELVGAGAVVTPPSGAATGPWTDPAVPGYGAAPYPGQQPWPQQPAVPPPYPYPYGTTPTYPQQAGYPAQAPYPAPPTYPQQPGYPVPPSYAPPPYPVAPAPGPTGAPPSAAPPPVVAEPAPPTLPGGEDPGPVHPPDH